MAKKYGEDWDLVQRYFFPGFSTLQLKNKYAATLRTSTVIHTSKSYQQPKHYQSHSTMTARQVRRETNVLHIP